jgi:hypothetical protein
LTTIQSRIKDRFGLDSEVIEAANVLFLRVQGLDNSSLADWIRLEFYNVYVSVKNRRTFEFSDDGWIKIEKNASDNRTTKEDTTLQS